MRFLVAGGAGLIGSAMCAALVGRGDDVVCVDNLLTGSRANVEELSGDDRFVFVEADITAGIPVDGPFDVVINLACPASPVDFGPLALEILSVGSTGLRNLLEAARGWDATFLQASTSEVYGEPLVHPQPESYWGNVNPVGPRSVYDEAKRFGEALTMAYHRRCGVAVRIARIFNTYGPRMRPDDGRVISNLVTQALSGKPLTVYGDGAQTRSFCYVDDEVAGILALLRSPLPGPVNIGNPAECSVAELARVVLEVTGSPSPIEHRPLPEDDPTQRRPDITLASGALGWAPQVTLRDGLRRTADWFARQAVRPARRG